MSQIHCKLVFRQFKQKEIDQFHMLCRNYTFESCSGINITETVHYGDDADATDEREETTFSFLLPKAFGDERYRIRAKALSELTCVFESFQKDLRTQNMADSATVCMIIQSKNIYPQFFDLVNVFNVDKIVLGSIINRRYLAPSFLFDEPKNGKEVFDRYLDEHRGYRAPHKNMLACFEHDRDNFVVCFPDIMKGEKQNRADQDVDTRSNDRVVDLRVSYSAIRRLIVTMRNELNAEGHPEIKVTFTFQISTPPFIYIHEMMKSTDEGKKLMFKAPSRFLTWNRRLDVGNSFKYGSSIVLDCSDVNPRTLFDCLDRLRKNITTAIEFRFLDRKKLRNIKNYNRNAEIFMKEPVNLEKKYQKLFNQPEKYFPLVYAVQALISRGGEVFEYFFRPEFNHFGTFLDLCIERFEQNLSDEPQAKITKTVVTLESLLQLVDRLTDIPEFVTLFDKLYDESGHRTHAEVTADLDREGYMRVRKLLITPTRHLYVNPELIMGNRFLRKYGSEKTLRILFRDDDGFKLSNNNRNVTLRCVRSVLMDGLTVAGEKYVMIGSSCSQLRDNGCYFVQGTVEEANYLRGSFGKFKIEPIPKMMARLGQVFTQSKLSSVRIDRNAYGKTPDYEGGTNSHGKSYCFSDGVGVISSSFASRISKDFNFNGSVPSCFQFRFRGFKGVLSVSPALDAMVDWHDGNGINVDHIKHEIQLRNSQEKFKGPREEFIEIVKHSAASAVSLNKPMLNIMDQVSKLQSSTNHDRITKRVHRLLNCHVNRILGSLNNEKDALSSIAEFPKLIMTRRLNNFCLHQEPFFRSMLRASALFHLTKLTTKMRISIPPSLGRSLFGICDESGLLQSGQVFVRYTTNYLDKLPQAFADKQVLVGKVLITKNPAVVAGDVRIFDAVDIPTLRHLSDVVVFPRYGPRPHPDEMAGSDLDGDEYTVIWDPELLLEKNEPAFDYSVPAKKPDEDRIIQEESDFQECMIDFFIDYIRQDSIGQFANAHLANSDLYGINSEHSNNIALKHNQAVDFPKTGVAPPRLRNQWNEDMPPERVLRFPDFMGKKQRLCYRSRNLMGALYRAVEDIETILKHAETISASNESVELDEAFDINEAQIEESVMNFVKTQYSRYSAQLQELLETYGICSEGELFSGHFSKIKGKLTDSGGDNDDLSLFNTTGIVQQRLAELFASFRTQFFDYFPGGRSYLVANERVQISFYSADILGQVCFQPTAEMCNVAIAYYNYAYKSSSNRYLSFPWLVWDVMAFVKQNFIVQNNLKLSIDALGEKLTKHIFAVVKSDDQTIIKKIFDLKAVFSTNEWEPVYRYTKIYECLYELLVFVILWSEQHNLKINHLNLCALCIGISNGTIYPDIENYYPWLESPEIVFASSEPVYLTHRVGSLGRCLVSMFSALSSNKMQDLNTLFISIGEWKFSFSNEELLFIRDAALTTFYHLSLTDTKFVLPQPSTSDQIAHYSPIIEGHPILIEVTSSSLDRCLAALKERANEIGCCYLATRVLSKLPGHNRKISLVARGTLQQIRTFYYSLSVTPKESLSARAQYDDMVQQVSRSLLSNK